MRIHNLLQQALLLTFSAIAISSCNKFTRDQPACVIIAEERPFPEGTDILNNNVFYNDHERTVSYKSSNGQLTTIHYPGTMTVLGTPADFWFKKTFTVNEAGMLTDERIENEDGTDWEDLSYEYQNSVQLVLSVTTTPHQFPATFKYTWSGGNLTSSILQAPGELTDVYDYYLDKPSAPGDYFTHRNITSAHGFRVFVSKNLPKSVQSFSSSSSFTYQKDNKGKIIFMTITTGGSPYTIKYDYLCDMVNYPNK